MRRNQHPPAAERTKGDRTSCFSRPGKFVLLAIPFILLPGILRSQENPQIRESLAGVWQQAQSGHYLESVDLRFDRPVYLTGEEAWYRLSCAEAVSGQPTRLSRIAYLELFSPENKVVHQAVLPLDSGRTSSSIRLPLYLGSGHYSVRAYTSWMKNQPQEQWYSGYITIVNPFQKPALRARSDEWALSAVPECGWLVEGLPNRIAYRIEGPESLPGPGRLYLCSDLGDTLCRIENPAGPLGFLEFVPDRHRSYTLHFSSAGLPAASAQLDPVQSAGALIRPEGPHGNYLDMRIEAAGVAFPLELAVHRNGVLFERKSLNPADLERTVRISVPRAAADRFEVLLIDAQNRIVAERPFALRDPSDRLLQIETDRESYRSRSLVRMKIRIPDTMEANPAKNAIVSVFRYEDALDVQIEAEYDRSMLTGPAPDAPGRNAGPIESSRSAEEWDIMTVLAHSPADTAQIRRWCSLQRQWLPEIRGPVVTAHILQPGGDQPLPYGIAALSRIGPDWQFTAARGDAAGTVHFEVTDFTGSRRMILQPVADSTRQNRIRAERPFSAVEPSMRLPVFDLEENLGAYLVDLSTNMQIRTNYTDQFKNREEAAATDTLAFFGEPDERYYLGDYTRFPVMEEVMREYVQGVLVRKRRGSFFFRVIDPDNKDVFRTDPLVLFDGVPVLDADWIMQYDPLKIKRIDVITRKYMIGPMVAHGAISFVSYKNDLAGYEPHEGVLVLPYPGFETRRQPWPADYGMESQRESRLPDYRNLLYWDPSLTLPESRVANVAFYTSDATGAYMISVEVMDRDGKRMSARHIIRVENP
jgi:hypothetical protein